MIKRLIGGSSLLLILVLVIIACKSEHDELEHFRNPNDLSSYDPDGGYSDSETGYYEIDPETILATLEQGETDVFIPLLEGSEWPSEVSDITISWTQADFLEVASVLGKLTWGDSMDLEDWKVYFLLFQGSCQDTSRGFHYAKITYFKTIEVSGRNVYTTRLIEIDPYGSVVSWGSGAIYPQSDNHWNDFDMVGSAITAEEALRIADENGGEETRLQDDNVCLIHAVSSHHNDNENWRVKYFTTPGFEMYIDLDTGEYEVLNSDQ